MYANVRRAQGALTRVTPDVPIYVLGYPSSAASFNPLISTVNEAHSVAFVGIELFQRALETHMIRARPIRRLACL